MVCGYTPFQGETVKDTKLAMVRGFLEFPSFLSSEVQSLIRCMLDLDASTSGPGRPAHSPDSSLTFTWSVRRSAIHD